MSLRQPQFRTQWQRSFKLDQKDQSEHLWQILFLFSGVGLHNAVEYQVSAVVFMQISFSVTQYFWWLNSHYVGKPPQIS